MPAKHQFLTVIQNQSRFPIDFVWENAKDLEHVSFLHRQTNFAFKLLGHTPDSLHEHEYSTLFYRASRKLFVVKFQSVGFRKIMSKYNLQQLEYIPLLGITSCLNSRLVATQDPDFPTLMVDEVVMEVPKWMAPLESYFRKALQRHATIQCAEDEPFRKRRQELAQRNIRFPFSLFNRSHWEELAEKFQTSKQSIFRQKSFSAGDLSTS